MRYTFKLIKSALFILLFANFQDVFSQDAPSSSSTDVFRINATYSDKGLNFKTSNDLFNGSLGFRLQFRFYTPFDKDPISLEDFTEDSRTSFIIRRARLKSKGSVYRPWLKYALDYDIVGQNLLNAEIRIEKYEFFGVRIGRSKVSFNRERVISSGKQSLVDRSIVNRVFTLDRHEGVEFYGTVGGKSPASFSYSISAYTGTGIQDGINNDDKLLYIGRLQWNFIGGGIQSGKADSDVEISADPKASIAFAAATNTSPYTRFSTSGGSQLEILDSEEPGLYQVDQFVEDFLFQWKGFSLLHEFHVKKVEDKLTGETTEMTGFLAQLGIFPHGVVSSMPRQLQVAARYAHVDPDREGSFNNRNELSVGMNWYFNGFRNRLSVDYSHLTLQLPVENVDANRFRIQWDISF